jgi:hypothetical protein
MMMVVVVMVVMAQLGRAPLPVQVEAALAVVRGRGAHTQHHLFGKRQGRMAPHHALAPHALVVLLPLLEDPAA